MCPSALTTWANARQIALQVPRQQPCLTKGLCAKQHAGIPWGGKGRQRRLPGAFMGLDPQA